MEADRKLQYSVLVLFLVLATGTIGYQLVEGWSFLDSLYMTVITLATIGYREVHELSTGGKIFTMSLVFFGVGAMAYALRNATHVMLEGELRHVLGRRKLKRTLRGLKNHYIICGFGRMGRIIASEFREDGVQFVVIENKPNVVAGIPDADLLVIQGDSTQDAILHEASIGEAKGLVSVLSSDADNLLVVLSARSLNPALRIVARASADDIEAKLKRAGADKVISPYHMGGIRMAHAMLKPTVTDFLEITVQDKTVDLDLEELCVAEGSKLAGRALNDSNIRRDYGAILVALKRKSGEMIFAPTGETRIEAGDTMIVLGQVKQLEKMEELTAAGR